jgi:hypothetical protein
MYCGSINRSGQSLQKALAHILVVITDDIDHRIRFDPLGVGLLLDQMRLQHPLAGIVVALVEAVGRQITDHPSAQQLLRPLGFSCGQG